MNEKVYVYEAIIQSFESGRGSLIEGIKFYKKKQEAGQAPCSDNIFIINC